MLSKLELTPVPQLLLILIINVALNLLGKDLTNILSPVLTDQAGFSPSVDFFHFVSEQNLSQCFTLTVMQTFTALKSPSISWLEIIKQCDSDLCNVSRAKVRM